MGAFIVGGIVFALSVTVSGALILANEAQHPYEIKYPALGVFCVGSVISGLIVGSHFIGW